MIPLRTYFSVLAKALSTALVFKVLINGRKLIAVLSAFANSFSKYSQGVPREAAPTFTELPKNTLMIGSISARLKELN